MNVDEAWRIARNIATSCWEATNNGVRVILDAFALGAPGEG